MKVDLGTTDTGPEDFDVYVDLFPNPSVPPEKFRQADLRYRWPFEDSTVELLRAFDLIEHLPDKIFTMNEAWRVLQPGGVFHIFVPVTPGAGAWCDPTHVSYWNRLSFDYYLEEKLERIRFAAHYGILAKFKVLDESSLIRPVDYKSGRVTVEYLEMKLEAVKPSAAQEAQ